MKLTANFSEEELRVEQADARVRGNARILCAEILEPVRAHFGKPVIVTSGYRPPLLNAAAGGKTKSFHLYEDGRCAADFKVQDTPIVLVFDWLRLESKLPFDKAILEYRGAEPRIVHVQMDVNNAPRRLAYTGQTGAGTTYTSVEVA